MRFPFRTSLIAAAVPALLGLFLWFSLREPGLNSWPIRGLPVGSGAILCFGDSLVSGVGADAASEAYPALLEQELGRSVRAQGTPGQTTAEALSDVQGGHFEAGTLVIVTLGGNDMLRRVPLETTLGNLRGIFRELQAAGCAVAFTGVEGLISRRRGKAYRRLCAELGVVYVPDILGGVLGDEDLKADPIHPNGKGYRIMARRVADTVRPFL